MSPNATTAELQSAIDAVWEERQGINQGTTGVVRDTVEAALDLLDKGEVRVAEKDAGRVDRQPVAQEGGAAVVPPERHGSHLGRARRGDLVGQGALQVRRHDAGRFPPRRLPRGARRDRAPLGLHRAQRGADAVVREPRRLRRRGHHGRHLGDRRLLRADRQELPHLGRRRHRRRARAAAGRPRHHRGQLLHRRARRGGRRRASSAKARCCRWASISAPRPRSSTARRARSISARCRRIRSSCPARCPASRCPTARPGPNLYCAVIVKRVDEKTRAKTIINELLRD